MPRQKARLAQSIEHGIRSGLAPTMEDVEQPVYNAATDTHRDLEAELSALQRDINELADKIVRVTFQEKHGRYMPGNRESGRNWKATEIEVWGHHYSRIGKPRNTKVHTLMIAEMQRMKANMEQHWEAIGPRTDGEQGRFGDD